MKPQNHLRRTQLSILKIFIILELFTLSCQNKPPEKQDPTAIIFPIPNSISTITPFQPNPPTLTPQPSPTHTPSPIPCQEQEGEIIEHNIQSSFLSGTLDFRVYLPPCYPSHNSPYPVLYLFHGLSYSDEQWDQLGIDEKANELIHNQTIPPLIIVMPYEKNSLLRPDSTGFGQAIINDLLPWIESNYSVCTQRSCRAIGGISRGGNWAVRIGLLNWESFSAIGSHSSPLFYEDAPEIAYWIEEIPTESMPNLFLDIGQSDSLYADAAYFHQILDEHDIAHIWQTLPGSHSEIYWKKQIDTYLLWYTANWIDMQ